MRARNPPGEAAAKAVNQCIHFVNFRTIYGMPACILGHQSSSPRPARGLDMVAAFHVVALASEVPIMVPELFDDMRDNIPNEF